MQAHGVSKLKTKSKRNEMWYSRQTEYNVQQVGELQKSEIGERKQKCIEVGIRKMPRLGEVTCGGRLFQTSASEIEIVVEYAHSQLFQ